MLSVFCCFVEISDEFALAPATVGGIASSAGRISNTIKVSRIYFKYKIIMKCFCSLLFIIIVRL